MKKKNFKKKTKAGFLVGSKITVFGFTRYSNRGDAPNINCFEQLFTNCLESRRVHSIYTRLKKKEDDILKGTYVPSKGKGMKRNKLQQKSMKTRILMSVCLLMMITTLKLMI